MWQGRRPSKGRKARPSVEGLETRMLLSTVAPAAEVAGLAGRGMGHPSRSIVGLGVLGEGPVQLASRQEGVANIVVRRSTTAGRATVELSTSMTPHVSTSSLPLRELVQFEPGESVQIVSVPLPVLGPVSAEVEVPLYLRPQSPGVLIERPGRIHSQRGPIGPRAAGVLRIVDRPDVIPPRIVSTGFSRQGFELMFSEPMDPVRASYHRNYRVQERAESNALSFLNPLRIGQKSGPDPIQIRDAIYNPATSTVTLVPSRPVDPSKTYELRALDAYTVPQQQLVREPLLGLRDASGNALEPTMLLVSRNPIP
ncbi:hypothetical protein BH23PLA1_BH23PLA1_26350 [soil metagenome]